MKYLRQFNPDVICGWDSMVHDLIAATPLQGLVLLLCIRSASCSILMMNKPSHTCVQPLYQFGGEVGRRERSWMWRSRLCHPILQMLRAWRITDVKDPGFATLCPASEEGMKDRGCEDPGCVNQSCRWGGHEGSWMWRIQTMSPNPASNEGVKDRGCEDPGCVNQSCKWGGHQGSWMWGSRPWGLILQVSNSSGSWTPCILFPEILVEL